MFLNPIICNEGKTGDIFSENLRNRIVFLTGEIDQNLSSSIIAQLLYLDALDPGKTINVYINSGGGECSSGLAIYDCIRGLKSPVAVTVTGMAASMAAVILSGGTKGMRYILPHSSVMIHQPSSAVEGRAEDILVTAGRIKKLRKTLNNILAENCGRKPEYIEKLTAPGDAWFDASEAIELGIADKIVQGEC